MIPGYRSKSTAVSVKVRGYDYAKGLAAARMPLQANQRRSLAGWFAAAVICLSVGCVGLAREWPSEVSSRLLCWGASFLVALPIRWYFARRENATLAATNQLLAQEDEEHGGADAER